MPSIYDDPDFDAPPSAQRTGLGAGPQRPIARYRPPPVFPEDEISPASLNEEKKAPASRHEPHSAPQPVTTQTRPSSSALPSSRTTVTRAAAPSCRIFDPWNTSATGHQRAENLLAGSTSWRESRSLKLSEQYRGGLSGGSKRVADTVGAGSEDFGRDGRTANGGWVRGAQGLRTGGQKSLLEIWGARKGGARMEEKVKGNGVGEVTEVAKLDDQDDGVDEAMKNDVSGVVNADGPKQIFSSLAFYLNGSTMPQISDHKLKHLIAAHGGSMSISLSKRRITHVILGKADGPGRCGGGLAASKIQKEISTLRGKGVKFVTADWVLDCLKNGKRVPEAGYSTGVKVARARQGSVYGMFGGGAKRV